jgi:transcriptional regulator with XRE-family HTH domain
MNTIKELRKANNLSQNQLAKKLNISKRTIEDWESGRRNPSDYNYKKLSSFFNVPIDLLKAQIVISNDKNKIKSVLKDNTTGDYQIIFNQKVENTKDPLLKIKLDKVIKKTTQKITSMQVLTVLITLIIGTVIGVFATRETSYNYTNATLIVEKEYCGDLLCVLNVKEILYGSFNGNKVEIYKSLLDENYTTYKIKLNIAGNIIYIEPIE